MFQGEHDWYLGVEDATYTTRRTADWDYNDVVVKWAAQPVPEFVPEPVPEIVPDVRVEAIGEIRTQQ